MIIWLCGKADPRNSENEFVCEPAIYDATRSGKPPVASAAIHLSYETKSEASHIEQLAGIAP
jgi:hypothetical protein